jgi:hypothetical protein
MIRETIVAVVMSDDGGGKDSSTFMNDQWPRGNQNSTWDKLQLSDLPLP